VQALEDQLRTLLSSKKTTLYSLDSWPSELEQLACFISESCGWPTRTTQGIEVVEAETLNEGATASYPYLVEDVRKMFLDRVERRCLF
jgi:hypothetical protein